MSNRLGVFFIGARGNVATLAVAGAAAIAKGLAKPVGMVSSTREFQELELTALDQMVFGGVDVIEEDLNEKLREMADAGRMLSPALPPLLRSEIDAYQHNIALVPCLKAKSPDYRGLIQRVSEHIDAFKAQHQLQRVVVVNLGSTEAGVAIHPSHRSANEFCNALKANVPGVANHSMVYAVAAIECGCPFVNFTPNPACEIPAIAEMAEQAGLPFAGSDGKTGETLIKTVLGPMFTARGFQVLSWLANNYLGNGDGRSLADPTARATKLSSKDEALRSILGGEAHLSTDIGYAPSLDDWKTAWDLIHFEGFLGTKMSMQFTWQGCDSTLAAPLVLDLVRLIDYAAQQGESGALDWLASFFKSPLGTREHAFFEQFAMLQDKVAAWSGAERKV